MKIEKLVNAFFIAAMIVLFSVGIYFRYILGRGLAFYHEYALLFFIWVSYIGASLAERDNNHYQVGFIYSLFSEKNKMIMKIILTSLKIVFYIILVVTAARVMPRQYFRRMPLTLSKSLFTLALFVGFILMILTNVSRLIECIKEMKSKY